MAEMIAKKTLTSGASVKRDPVRFALDHIPLYGGNMDAIYATGQC